MLNLLLIFKRYSSNQLIKKCFDNFPVYTETIKFDLERHWRNIIDDSIQKSSTTETHYVLSMFPYPSGQLHLGHMRVYTVADVIARFQRLCGRSVIFPMGWDSFGLPAENAAFERGLEPKEWTMRNIDEMKKQMKDQMTLSIDWSREISTCDPKYFKWTQWIFARLFDKGFAYQRSDIVNWDPVDRTVLAKELIDEEGRSWRSGAIVEKKPLKQWFLRTTAFTESLLTGLDTINGEQWRHVVEAQQGWLGKLEGVYVELDLIDLWDNNKCLEQLAVFTTKPVAVLTDLVAFVEINEGNVWWESVAVRDNKIGPHPVLHSRLAVKHPISGRIIPIVMNPSLKVNDEECLTSRFCIPFLDLNDARTAAKLGIPSSSVHLGAYDRIKGSAWRASEGRLLDGDVEESLGDQAISTLQQIGRGGYRCSKLRTDWLVSRQRYWGTPIPIVHCPDCGPVLVPDDQLPVELPPFAACQSSPSRGDTSSPLASVSSWVDTSCPKCANPQSRRESDTMDTFVDSSWYYLRYLDPKNHSELCAQHLVAAHMPVDIYIGGVEHAIRHLFYARFVAHFLHYHSELKSPHGPEPFSQFLPIGLVLGQTYRTKLGQFVPSEKVKFADESQRNPTHIDSGESLVQYWDKMSKSKHNGISPESVVQRYGLDSTRLILLSNTGPDKRRKWQENDVALGIVNWEKRLWRLVSCALEGARVGGAGGMFLAEDVLMVDAPFLSEYEHAMSRILDCYSTHTFSAVIAYLQRLTSGLLKASSRIDCHQSILFYRILFDFLVLLHPLSPLLSSELWAQLSCGVAHSEAVFSDSSERYSPLCGVWCYSLTKPVWEQSLLGLTQKDIDRIKQQPSTIVLTK